MLSGGMGMLGRRGRKERKRLMALLLAGAMVLSGMGISPISVQAEETEPVVEQVKETVSDGNAEMTENVGNVNDIALSSAKNIADESAVQAAETVVQSADGQYVFDAATDSVVSKLEQNVKIDAGKYGTEGYFTFSGSVKRAKSSTLSAELDKAEKGLLTFTVSGTADATFKVSSTGSDKSSVIILKDAAGDGVVAKGKEEALIVVAGTSATEIKYEGLKTGDYTLCSPLNEAYDRGFRLYSATVSETTGGSKPARADWSTVEVPTVISAAQSADNKNNIEVKISGNVGYDGADALSVTMINADGEVAATQNAATKGTEHSVSFTPAASGTYTFSVKAIRADEEDKQGTETKSCEFVLPLTKPVIKGVTCQGGGKAKVAWNAVKEAEKYLVTVDGAYTTDGKSIEKEVTAPATDTVVEGLKVDQEAVIYVTAVRGDDKMTSAGFSKKIVDEVQYEWAFTYYGPSASSSKNKYEGDATTGTVKVVADAGGGKLQPTATDGLGFYYTAIPTDKNFTFSATLKVNKWTPNNGQEGFGIMAADRVGAPGEGSNAYWNNSYMAVVGKVEYNWDAANGKVSDAGDKISMKLGIGAQEKSGVTYENLDALNANDSATLKSDYKTSMWPLETSCAQSGTGTYNLIGNNTAEAKGTTVDNPVTELKLTIQKNNTGYFISYTDAAGNTETKKYYGTETLNVLDDEYVYVGMFAARGVDITYSDINLTLIDPADDAPAEEREMTLVTPACNIISAAVSNSAAYDLIYSGNADGKLSVTAADGSAVVSDRAVTAGTKVTMPVSLTEGSNKFRISFTPNSDYRPNEYSKLSSYETVTYEFTVTYKSVRRDQKTIYVAPEGSAGAAGSKENPVDIYTAVKYAKAGQMIVLKGGVYNLTSTIKVERGIDGTKEQMIYLIADPSDSQRPVFDFNRACAGMIFAGDYWYCQGFDVTNTQDTQKGIQISGSNCVFDNIQAYHNGNTGIQVSRYLTTDEREDWPSNDLILNCTSYGNADIGYEDADGFAAKLTVGDGIVFDGCISYNNADDGWDLFAKVETGSIGSVTIKNCVAYGNGYLEDGTDAGNGNGFKMGGSSITGYHTLINSVAFGNKAKGIDSNSCPDIQVKQSTSFNNESYNVAFYTNAGSKTDFGATGILSYRTKNLTQQEQLKLLQEETTIRTTMNYFWNETKQESTNSEGNVAKDSWFVSTTDPQVTRNADGTINMNGFLTLTAEAPAGVGARMTGTPSAVFTVAADVVNNDDDDDDDDDNNSGSSAAPAVDWTDVSNSVQDKVAEMLQNPAIASVNMNFVCSGEVKVPQNVLNTIKGTKLTVAFHSGNGVALSISGQDLKNKDLSKIQNIDLTVDQTSNTIPANVVSAKSGTVNRQLGIRDTGSFGVNVNIHVNVGKDNAGKSANLYRYNAEKGRLEYCGSFTVTSTGQSMFALKRGGNYLVTVTDRRPSESIWYTEGDYTVKGGDTLSKIAKRNHMTLAELLRRNAQITNQNVIRVGQKLNLD